MCVCVCMCVSVCVSPHEAIISYVIQTMYDWLNKFYSFYIAAVVSSVSRCDLSIDVCHRNRPNKSNTVKAITLTLTMD